MEELLSKIDELIATTKAASIPLEKRWLDSDGVGAMLGFKGRYVLETLSLRPDFPKPMRVDGTGHPRWLASEVSEWAEAERLKQKGRPRIR